MPWRSVFVLQRALPTTSLGRVAAVFTALGLLPNATVFSRSPCGCSRPLSAGPGPALACATTPYLAAEGQAQAPELPSGERERLGGRQHEYAHTQALALRALCPLSGGREPACEDASPECAPRAAAGECARSPSYMSSMCCASCAGRAGATAEAAAGAEWACVAGATISADAVERALAAVRERRPGAKR